MLDAILNIQIKDGRLVFGYVLTSSGIVFFFDFLIFGLADA